MSLQIILLTKLAKSPELNEDQSYNVFSSEEKTLKSNETNKFNTHIIISPPVGYRFIINSTELVDSHNIETSSFCCSKLNNLILTLRNLGYTNYRINIGDVIGKLILVKNYTFPIKIVRTIEIDCDNSDNDDNQEHLKNITKSIMQSYILWFKKIYVESPKDTITKYLTIENITELDSFHESQAYKDAHNKIQFEANYIWPKLSAETQLLIKNDYNNVKRNIISNDPICDNTNTNTTNTNTSKTNTTNTNTTNTNTTDTQYY